VLRTVSIVCQVHRAFTCDQLLVPWSHGVELPDQTFEDLDPPELCGYRVPLDTQVYLRSRQTKCSLVVWLMA
jgi:hypothetical protein